MRERVAAHLRISTEPVADPKAVVCDRNVRVTVLTPRLLRIEYDSTGDFEDRPSQTFWFRGQPVPPFTHGVNAGTLTVETQHLTLVCSDTGRPFDAGTLTVELKESGATWCFGQEETGNLGGPSRTLDNKDGPIPLGDGLMSREGWSVVDDSEALMFAKDSWLEPRRHNRDRSDLYFFGHGRDYQGCLQDFTKVAGPIPLVPRWALGNWWSRYWAYTDRELLALMDEFRGRGIPLSVCVIDMDWHVVKNDYHRGWTGYTWSRDHFPEPERFLRAMHERGLKVSLNLHPHGGIHPHEDAYPAMAAAVGIDPAAGEPVPFDIADPVFTRAYFEHLHHPLERQGVDFWWMDWQQGSSSALDGLDPLWWLNHLHYYDLAREGDKRPFVFSRWGGYGNHRYQIGFSGDAHITWRSLAFQPYFTSSASNTGYTWWSHDIGGHFKGMQEPELYARWVQFGVFSPIMRLHAAKSAYNERRPWVMGTEAYHTARDAMRLRHAMVPYLYAMARRTHAEAFPLVRPMYWSHPETDEAYACPNQYWFGSELIAAPFLKPRDPDTRLSRAVAWLPEGSWYDFFTGEHHEGGEWKALYGAIEDIPVFAREGAIVPLAAGESLEGTGNPAALRLRVFAGADNTFELYEDDGESSAFESGAFAVTSIAQKWDETAMTLTVSAARGDTALVPAVRSFTAEVVGVREPGSVSLEVDGVPREAACAHDAASETLRVDLGEIPAGSTAVLTLAAGEGTLRARRDRTVERCTSMLAHFITHTHVKGRVRDRLEDIRRDPAALLEFRALLTESQRRALLEVLCGAGVELIDNIGVGKFSDEKAVVMWNNRESDRIRFHFVSSMRSYDGHGVVPRFKRIGLNKKPNGQPDSLWYNEKWALCLDYSGMAAVELGSGELSL